MVGGESPDPCRGRGKVAALLAKSLDKREKAGQIIGMNLVTPQTVAQEKGPPGADRAGCLLSRRFTDKGNST